MPFSALGLDNTEICNLFHFLRRIKLLMERDEVMEKKRIQENQVETQEVECDAKLVAKETKCEELETEVGSCL